MGTEIWCLVLVLVGLLVHQQIFFTKQIQRLVDKLMSRSFVEYQKAQEPPVPKLVPDPEVPDDLRSLQGFSINLS